MFIAQNYQESIAAPATPTMVLEALCQMMHDRPTAEMLRVPHKAAVIRYNTRVNDFKLGGMLHYAAGG